MEHSRLPSAGEGEGGFGLETSGIRSVYPLRKRLVKHFEVTTERAQSCILKGVSEAKLINSGLLDKSGAIFSVLYPSEMLGNTSKVHPVFFFSKPNLSA